MKINLKSITRKAIALLVVGAAGTGWLGGADAGLGFILGGLLMIASFGAGWWMTQPGPNGSFSQRRIVALTTIKFPIVGFLAWVCLNNFPPVAVALGGMVLVFSISLDAYISTRFADLSLNSTANTTGNT